MHDESISPSILVSVPEIEKMRNVLDTGLEIGCDTDNSLFPAFALQVGDDSDSSGYLIPVARNICHP